MSFNSGPGQGTSMATMEEVWVHHIKQVGLALWPSCPPGTVSFSTSFRWIPHGGVFDPRSFQTCPQITSFATRRCSDQLIDEH